MLKNSLANAGDTRDKSSILVSRRSSGEVNGKPLQYSCLENSMGRGAWQAIVHGVTKSQICTVHCITTEDKYLLHYFIWVKPVVVTYKEKIGKNKVKIIL